MYQGYSIFFSKVNNGFILSKDMTIISSLKGNFSLNKEYCYRILTNTWFFNNDSMANDVKQIQFGTKVNILNQSIKEVDVFNISSSNLNSIFEIIKYNILHFIRYDMYLFLSSGLDSSLLFFCLKDLNIKFKAIHILPKKYESDSELDETISLCRKYSIPLILIYDENNLSYLKKYRYENINIEYLTHGDLEVLIKEDNNIFFNGRGGDSVFLQNPDLNIGMDAYKQNGFIFALKKLRELSRLKGVNFLTLIKENFRNFIYKYNKLNPNWLPLIDAENESYHPFLSPINPKYAKFSYILQILRAIELSRSQNENENIISPLLQHNVIMYFYNIPLVNMFSDRYDRLVIREEAYKKYNDFIFYKRKKRSSSMYLFNYYHENRDELKRLILNSDLIRLLNINQDMLKDELECIFNIKFTDSLPFIHNFILLQKNINQLSGN